MGTDAGVIDAGIDAAVRGDWALACECFAKETQDVRSGSRLAAGRAQAVFDQLKSVSMNIVTDLDQLKKIV